MFQKCAANLQIEIGPPKCTLFFADGNLCPTRKEWPCANVERRLRFGPALSWAYGKLQSAGHEREEPGRKITGRSTPTGRGPIDGYLPTYIPLPIPWNLQEFEFQRLTEEFHALFEIREIPINIMKNRRAKRLTFKLIEQIAMLLKNPWNVFFFQYRTAPRRGAFPVGLNGKGWNWKFVIT